MPRHNCHEIVLRSLGIFPVVCKTESQVIQDVAASVSIFVCDVRGRSYHRHLSVCRTKICKDNTCELTNARMEGVFSNRCPYLSIRRLARLHDTVSASNLWKIRLLLRCFRWTWNNHKAKHKNTCHSSKVNPVREHYIRLQKWHPHSVRTSQIPCCDSACALHITKYVPSHNLYHFHTLGTF